VGFLRLMTWAMLRRSYGTGATSKQPVRPLVKQGIIPAETGWSGWLGRYQAALARAAVSIQRADLKERHRQPQAR
jgi:hypothetical protein